MLSEVKTVKPRPSRLGRTVAWRVSASCKCAGHSCTAHSHAHSSALGPAFSRFCSSLPSCPVLGGSVKCCSDTIQSVFVFILVPLLTAYVTYSSSFKGLSRAQETMHSEGLCAVNNRPVTCLMKVGRTQICGFASPRSDTMSQWELGLGVLAC